MIQAGDTEGVSEIIRFVLEIENLKAVLRKVKPTGEAIDEPFRAPLGCFAFASGVPASADCLTNSAPCTTSGHQPG